MVTVAKTWLYVMSEDLKVLVSAVYHCIGRLQLPLVRGPVRVSRAPRSRPPGGGYRPGAFSPTWTDVLLNGTSLRTVAVAMGMPGGTCCRHPGGPASGPAPEGRPGRGSCWKLAWALLVPDSMLVHVLHTARLQLGS